MATQQEINQLSRQLGNIEWVVRGRPVVALFDKKNSASGEQEHLGQPFVRNEDSDTLLLWIGLDANAGHALITLTQRLSSSNRGRLLYLIVPSEVVNIDLDEPTHWTLSHENIPSTCMDGPSDDRSAHQARLLHISFILLRSSRVLMPSSRVTTPIGAQRVLLLRKFKALSEATRFELFTNHDTNVARSLLKTQILLNQGRGFTPPISLKGLYPGSRDAVLNCWENEGLLPDTFGQTHCKRALAESQPLADKRPRHITPTDHTLHPPPYELSAPPLQPAVTCVPSVAVGAVACDPSAAIATAVPAARPSLNVERESAPLYLQLPTWLTWAWSLCPKAHYIFVTELLALGAASQGHNTAKFDECRVAANTALLSHWAAELHKNGTGTRRSPATCSVDKHLVSDELSALLSWLSILDRQADIQTPLGGQADLALWSNLKALASTRQMFLDSEKHNEESRYNAYVNARAWFVTKACLRLGDSVLRCDKDIKQRMIDEMARLEKNKCNECLGLENS